jgi:hypothetical protein
MYVLEFGKNTTSANWYLQQKIQVTASYDPFKLNCQMSISPSLASFRTVIQSLVILGLVQTNEIQVTIIL